MKIAVFGRSVNESRKDVIRTLYRKIHELGCEVYIYEPFLKGSKSLLPDECVFSTFNSSEELANSGSSCLFTVGGDGTLLEAVTLIRASQIPVLGINTGRLGFLSSFSSDEVSEAVEMAVAKNYSIDYRTLVELDADGQPFGSFPIALNEVTLHKKESSTMITVHVHMDGQFLNSYWADGLIIATPTGSTGYSLSCGGPILMPESSNLVITPIAPHNLNVRPLVIDDSKTLVIETNVRGKNLLLALDSRSVSFPADRLITIRKAPFQLLLGRKPDQNFLKTLREKLMWGIDKRN